MELVTTPTQISVLAQRIANETDKIGFDTESSGPQGTHTDFLNVYRSQMTGMSFAFPTAESYYVPTGHHYEGNASPLLVKTLCRAMGDSPATIWAHNWKHDMCVLKQEGLWDDRINYACSQVLVWLLQRMADGKSPYGLKAQAKQFLNMEMSEFKDVTKLSASFAGLKFADSPDHLSAAPAVVYACEDAIASLMLAEQCYPALVQDRLDVPFWEQEMPFVPVLENMERNGWLVNRQHLTDIAAELQPRLNKVQAEWNSLFPEISISSPKQLQALYAEGEWAKSCADLTDTGDYKVNKDAIQALLRRCRPGSKGLRAAQLKQEFAFLSKNLSTYTTKLVDMAEDHTDGRIRGSFNHTGTVTGRLSASKPNMQNIPVRTEMGKRIREAFIAEQGDVLISSDYSQIELRVLAHLCKEGRLFEAYKNGEDVHQQLADAVRVSRDGAKTLNFSFIYGSGDKKLGKQLGVTKSEATKFRLGLEELRPEVLGLRKRVHDAAYRRGFVRTISGRRRNFPELVGIRSSRYARKSRSAMLDQFSGERKAFNTPVQGGAGDIFKIGLTKFYNAIKDSNDVRLIGQVHDDVISECAIDISEEVAILKRKCLESAVQLRVPLVAEPIIGNTWRELK